MLIEYHERLYSVMPQTETEHHERPKKDQVEIWFSILARRLLKRTSFCSIEDLQQKILDFIAYFNKTMAKPFKWTFTGRPLVN